MIYFEKIFESTDFIVVNKLISCSYHSDSEDKGFFARVKLSYPEISSVHRLDRGTTGLVLFAKNLEATKQFNLLFKEHCIEKIYLALSSSKPSKKQGLVKGDLVKSRGGSYRISQSTQNPSISQFFSMSHSEGIRLFILKPHTGKTHQLRVVLKSLGSPIIGDERYKGAISDRMYLHAYKLKFLFNNKEYIFYADNILGNYFINKDLADIKESIESFSWPNLKRS